MESEVWRATGRRCVLARGNERTAIRTFESVSSETRLEGRGQRLYTLSRTLSLEAAPRPAGRSENCFETRTCFCNRRIDLTSTEKGMCN